MRALLLTWAAGPSSEQGVTSGKLFFRWLFPAFDLVSTKEIDQSDFSSSLRFSSASASFSSDWSSPPDFAYCKKNIMANGCAKETSLSAQRPAILTKQPPLVIPSSAQLPECSDFLGAMPSPATRNLVPPSETFCGNLTGEFGLQGSTSATSPSPRPFYSFLPAGPVRCERAPSECSADVPVAAVDLELKL
jgi:hypothetical protein